MAGIVIDVVAAAPGCTIILTDPPLSMTFPYTRVDFAPEASVTEHPVELGGKVSDHIQARPTRFVVDAIVTNSPRSVAMLGQPPNVNAALAFLSACVGKLLTVILDGEGTFDSMALEGFPHSRTAVEGRPISLRFKEVRLATALSVTVPPSVPAPVAAAGAPTEAPLGQQATTAAVPTSALKDIKDATSTLSPISLISSLLGF
jgi:hypothetical protein